MKGGSTKRRTARKVSTAEPRKRGRPRKEFVISGSRESMLAGMRGIRALGANAEQSLAWRGTAACPPGTLIDAVIQAFRKHTNAPLELPFSVVMTMLAWRLVQAGARLHVAGTDLSADLWTVVLASSGSLKTLTQRTIGAPLGLEPNFEGADSAAKWIAELERVAGVALWIRDEWGQQVRNIADPKSPLGDIRGYMLQSYDHSKISRKTLKGEILVERPCLVFLGFSVDETWPQQVTAEMIADGFGQRFCYLLGGRDPARPDSGYPYYDLNAIRDAIRSPAQAVLKIPIHHRYTYSAAARELYASTYQRQASDQLAESYYRRIMWRAHQFAAIYHLALHQSGSVISVAAMRYALRAVEMHCTDAWRVLRLCDTGGFLQLVERAESWARRRRAEGKPITARDLMRDVRGIANVRIAREVMYVWQP